MDLQQLKALKDIDLDIPSLYNITPYPFQKVGIAAITTHPRILVGDDTGLGKTVEAVGSLCLLHSRNELPRNSCLVIVPDNMVKEWLDILKANTPLHTIQIKTEDRKGKFLKQKFNVGVCSYNTARARRDLLELNTWHTIVLDEASNIKNHLSQTFQAVKSLTDKAQRVVILNATSFENSLTELYSTFEIIQPGTFSSYQSYLDKFCEVETKRFKTVYGTLKEYDKVLGAKSVEALNILTDMMKPFYFRRTAPEVGMQMPTQVIVPPIKVELLKEQKDAYVREIKRYQNKVITGGELLYNLLRVCDGKENWSKDEDPSKTSAKGKALEDLIVNLGNNQFVIFSVFIDPLLAAGKICKKLGKRIGFFTGENRDTREKHKEDFVAGKLDALLVSKSATHGLNLPNSQYLIQMNQLFNPLKTYQLRSRIKRITSKFSNSFIYNLIAKDSVEESILDLLENKGELGKYVNEDDDTFRANLSEEQVEKLLGRRLSLINKDSLERAASTYTS